MKSTMIIGLFAVLCFAAAYAEEEEEYVIDCSGYEDGILLPHPHDCALFYHCYSGLAQQDTCEYGLVFNYDLGVCDWIENTDCGYGPSARKIPAQAAIKPAGIVYPDPAIHCRGKQVGDIVSDPYHCNNYIQCTNTQRGFEMRTCSKGLFFNPAISVCDHARNVHCVPLPPPFKKTCADVPTGDSFPHNTDCNKFITCQNNATPFEMTCAPGLHYNEKLKVCDWPQSANCQL